MTETRLAARVVVDALRRLAEAAGAHATIVARGDAVAGAILVVARDRQGVELAYQRVAAGPEASEWAEAGPRAGGAAGVSAYLERRRAADPDLWIVEVDGHADPRALLTQIGR